MIDPLQKSWRTDHTSTVHLRHLAQNGHKRAAQLSIKQPSFIENTVIYDLIAAPDTRCRSTFRYRNKMHVNLSDFDCAAETYYLNTLAAPNVWGVCSAVD